MAKAKAVVGFENSGRIELFHATHVGNDGVAVGTIGADPTVFRLRVVPVRSEAFRYRLLVAAGSEAFQAVEFDG